MVDSVPDKNDGLRVALLVLSCDDRLSKSESQMLGLAADALASVPSAIEPQLSKIVDHAEVIGNVTAALLDLDATYVGNKVTFTFQSTNDAMSYIRRARLIVEERLALIRAFSDGGGA